MVYRQQKCVVLNRSTLFTVDVIKTVTLLLRVVGYNYGALKNDVGVPTILIPDEITHREVTVPRNASEKWFL